MSKIPLVPCHIKELNISCFGCCGNKFSSQETIVEDIKSNTNELKLRSHTLNKEKLMEFRERFDGDTALSLNGLCYNFVDLGGCLGCPLHPQVNTLEPKNFKIENTEDLRIGHCDINEECETFKNWKTMNDDEKRDFLRWLKKNKYNTYRYSVENGEEKLFENYLKKNSS